MCDDSDEQTLANPRTPLILRRISRRLTALIGSLSLTVALIGAVAPAPASAAVPQAGYWVVTSRGTVYPIGYVSNLSPGFSLPPSTPAVAIVSGPGTQGYWIATASGNVYNFGNVAWHGSPWAGGLRNSAPFVGMVANTTGSGYYLVTAAGNVYNFGNAPWYGSLAGKPLSSKVVGISLDPSGNGYYLVTAAGNVYNFGNAPWKGSPAAMKLPASLNFVGISTDPASSGYWLAAQGGGIYSFSAPFYGSMGASNIPAPFTAMSSLPDGSGYRAVSSNGSVYNFGGATYFGTANGQQLNGPVVSIASGIGSPTATAGTSVRYPSGSTGYDISFPQCGNLPSSTTTIAVVGVNNGFAFSTNPCLKSEANWAGHGINLYMNLNQPAWNDPKQGLNGPDGACASTDQNCISYNYGWNAAQWSVQQTRAQSISAPMWWLDVEQAGNGYWSSNQSANAQVIAGALAGLAADGIAAGIYSTNYQFSSIAGTYHPNVPVWYPTGYSQSYTVNNASYFCNQTSFAGQIWMLQDGTASYDGDYAC